MNRKLVRMRALFERRGAWSLIQFLAGRLLVRRISSVVYQETDRPRSAGAWAPEEEFAIFTPSGPKGIEPELRRLLGGQEIAAGDWLFGIRVQGKWSSCGCAMFDSRQVRVLGESHDVLIGNCFTAPEKRGRGLYRRGLNEVLRCLRADGWTRILIETHPRNWPSRKGIERAGLQELKIVEGVIVFNRIVLAIVKARATSKLRAWFV